MNISKYLPIEFANYAVELAESLQLSEELTTSAILVAIATAVQGKFHVKIKDGYTEELNIAMMLIARSSERKSPLLNNVFSPITHYVRQFNEDNNTIIEQNKEELKLLLKTKEEIVKELSSTKQRKNENITEASLSEIVDKIINFDKPVNKKTLYVNDITLEALAVAIQNNDSKLTLIDDEGTIFKIVSGVYKNGVVDMDVLLRALSNDKIIQHRISRNEINISNPKLSALIAVQPIVANEILENKVFNEKGLAGRILKCKPISFIGHRKFDTEPVSYDIYNKYKDKLIKLLSIENETSVEICLSDSAYELLIKFSNNIEQMLNTNYKHIESFCGKLLGKAIRLAGLLEVANMEFEGDIMLGISQETMFYAIKLTEYYLSQELELYKSKAEETILIKRVNHLKDKLISLGIEKARDGYTPSMIKRLLRYDSLGINDKTPTEYINEVIDYLIADGSLISKIPKEAPTNARIRYYVTDELLKEKE